MRDVWLAAVAAALVACRREATLEAARNDAPPNASTSVGATAPGDSALVAVDTASATPSASAPGSVASKVLEAAPTATGLGGIGTVGSGVGNVDHRTSCGAVSRSSGICGAVSQTEVRGPTATITTSLSGATQTNDDRVVATMRPRLRMCANKALQRDPTLTGKVVLSISVAANGEVSQTSVVSNTGVGAEMAACMTSMARRAQFDAGSARTLVLTITQTHD